MDDLSHTHNTLSPRCSCPLRAYPYKRIRSSVMETQGTWSHNLLLDTFCSDQSLFRCLGGSSEMSLAGIWEVRVCASVWLGVFNVRCRIHLSNLLGADSFCALAWGVEEPLVIICEGCCIYDLFGAAAEIVLLHYTIIMASSVTQISSAPLNSPSSPPSRPPPPAEAFESRWRAGRTVWPRLIISLGCTVWPDQRETGGEKERRRKEGGENTTRRYVKYSVCLPVSPCYS